MLPKFERQMTSGGAQCGVDLCEWDFGLDLGSFSRVDRDLGLYDGPSAMGEMMAQLENTPSVAFWVFRCLSPTRVGDWGFYFLSYVRVRGSMTGQRRCRGLLEEEDCKRGIRRNLTTNIRGKCLVAVAVVIFCGGAARENYINNHNDLIKTGHE